LAPNFFREVRSVPAEVAAMRRKERSRLVMSSRLRSQGGVFVRI